MLFANASVEHLPLLSLGPCFSRFIPLTLFRHIASFLRQLWPPHTICLDHMALFHPFSPGLASLEDDPCHFHGPSSLSLMVLAGGRSS